MKATYSREDFEKIATAIGKDVGDVVKHKERFEWGADWYGLDRGLSREGRSRPRRTPPSKIREKLQRIAKSARRLLQALEIKSYEQADELRTSGKPGGRRRSERRRRRERDETTGQFGIILDAIEAATELERRALAAARDEIALGNLTVLKGPQGDAAVNNWVATMMEIYREITGAEPTTTVRRTCCAYQSRKRTPSLQGNGGASNAGCGDWICSRTY